MEIGNSQRSLFHSRAALFPNSNHDLRELLIPLPFDSSNENNQRSYGSWWSQLFGVDELFTIKEQWPQLIVAITLGSSAIYFDCLAQVYLQLHTIKTDVVLEDLGFTLLPRWDNVAINDYTLCLFAIITVGRFIVLTGPFSIRLTIIRRWFILVGILFFIRGCSIIFTVLPNPAKECVSTVKRTGKSGIGMQALYVMFGQRVTCADVLYSGHTFNLTLGLLVWWNYSHLCPLWRTSRMYLPFGKIFPSIYCVVAYTIIIASHFHYTVDVWLGFWMTYFVWNYYHEAIKSSPFYASPFSIFITWMEAEATDLHYWRMRGTSNYIMDLLQKQEANKDVQSDDEISEHKRSSFRKLMDDEKEAYPICPSTLKLPV